MKNLFYLLFILFISANSHAANIEGIDRAKLIQALHKNAISLGRGYKVDIPAESGISLEEAQLFVGQKTNIVNGKFLKVFVPHPEQGNDVNTELYNRENGEGLAEKVIQSLRSEAGKASSCHLYFKLPIIHRLVL